MKAYIIHLSKIESSLKSAQRLKKELENFGTDAELFEGSYGNETIVEYKKQGREHHPWTFKGPNKPVSDEFKKRQTTPGLLGCFDSHYRLWEKCVQIGKPIMIFEDDAHLQRGYQPVEFDEVLSLVFSHAKKMKKYIKYLENSYGPPQAMNYRPASMPGNAGYAIKPKAAIKLINMYKNTYLPADNAINQHIVKIQIHNYMMGKAELRERTGKRASLIRTDFWNEI